MKNFFKGLCMAFGMFSILPVPQVWDDTQLHRVIPATPAVGAVIGALWAGAAALLNLLGAPPLLFGVLLALLPLLLSGFIHIDGYMDCCDAIFSRAEPEKKRQILKDSHVGAFAVIGLCALLLLNFASACTGLEAKKSFAALLLLPVAARCLSGLALLWAHPASETGFAAAFRRGTGQVHRLVLLFFAALTLILGWPIGGPPLLLTLLGMTLAGLLGALYAIKQLGGVSGDVCGFAITLSESAGLLLWALL